MQHSDRFVNIVLVLMVAALLTVCVLSVVSQMQTEHKSPNTEYGTIK